MAKKKKSKTDSEYDLELIETLARIMRVSGNEKPSAKPWYPAKFKCRDCETIIFSRYPGEFVSCKCGKCFIDQTRYYARMSGDPELIEEGRDNGE